MGIKGFCIEKRGKGVPIGLTVTIGLTKLMWRRLELSYPFLSRGEGNARL